MESPSIGQQLPFEKMLVYARVMVTDEAIGMNVKRLRRELGLSQAELCTRLAEAGMDGVYTTTITKIEAGTRTIRLREAPLLAEALETSVSELLMAHLDRAIRLAKASNAARAAFQRVQESTRELFEAQEELSELLQQFDPEVGGFWREAGALEPETAVREARSEWQRLVEETAATSTPE